MKEIQSLIETLISSGRLDEAARKMADFARGEDEVTYNELLALSAQLAINENLFTRGNLIEPNEYIRNKSRISTSLIEILAQLNEGGLLNELKLAERTQKQVSTKKTKILYIAAQYNPKNRLALEMEYLELRKSFRNNRDLFEVTEEFDATLDSFFESILFEKPQIIHFAGAGSREMLMLIRKVDKSTHNIPYEFLASALKFTQKETELMFVNTGTSYLFAKVISRYIPFAIGATGVISDKTAITFSSGFYGALSIEKDYRKAFETALVNVYNPNMTPVQHGPNLRLDDAYAEPPYLLFENGYSPLDKNPNEEFYIPEIPTLDTETSR